MRSFKKSLVVLLLMIMMIPCNIFANGNRETVGEQEGNKNITSLDIVYPDGFDFDKAFAPAADNDGYVQLKAKKPPYKIGLSNSFIGNSWRVQMLQAAMAYVEEPFIKPFIESFKVTSSGQDVATQIAQIDMMIASGYDAIILDAAATTGYDAVINRAKKAGVLIVSFDNLVNSKEISLVGLDSVEWGRILGADMVERLGGKGNVVVVNGPAGATVNTERRDGIMSAFVGSDINVIAELDGQWDSGVGQTVMANFLATSPQVDGVVVQCGTPGVLKAFKNAGVPYPVVAGEAENGFRKLMASENLQGISIGYPPAQVNVAILAAVEMLRGEKLPRVMTLPIPSVRSEDMVEGVDYFNDIDSDDFFVALKIPEAGIDLTPAKLMKQIVEQ